MVYSSVWIVSLLPLLFLVNQLLKLAKNIQIARSTGLRYVTAPYYSYNRITSLLAARYILKHVNKIWPDPAFSTWRFLIRNGRPWKYPYAPFSELGTDTFLLVSPGGVVCHTADADVIAQIAARDKDFPKATWLYEAVSIYGQNVVSTDGAAWRHQRKLTAPAFTEKNNRLVWNETLEQSQAMLASWSSSVEVKTIDNVAGDAMQLSLNVINWAGFGQKTDWHSSSDEMAVRDDLPGGHTMTFLGSLKFLLKNVLMIMIVPKPLLKNLPNARLKKSYRAYQEWGQYMQEMIQAKKSEVINPKSESATIDLVGQLVKGQEIDYEGRRIALTDSEVMGNLFVFMIAGHETSANSIHFSLLFLALHPYIQKKVQKELDQIFRGRTISQWDYDHDMPLLQNSFLGAVLAEQLRLIPPALNIPKMTHSPQQVTIDNREVTLPRNMMIRLCVQSVHQHPKYWPHEAPSETMPRPQYPGWTQADDLDEFKPERWLSPDIAIEKQLGVADGTSPPFYQPPKGAYIPFSEGQRACLGKRFAQVEILTALAVILKSHSVELGVDEFTSDSELEMMDPLAKKAVWRQAEERAWWKLKNNMKCMITIQMQGKGVPMRFVNRGAERFVDL